jgi:hypothetical protein
MEPSRPDRKTAGSKRIAMLLRLGTPCRSPAAGRKAWPHKTMPCYVRVYGIQTCMGDGSRLANA